MPLSDRQIERYSRQIIVPGVGGLGQQRLLDGKLMLCGEPSDLETPLVYLVGAGVGTIRIAMPGGAAFDPGRIADLRSLNPDSRIIADDEPGGADGLTFALVGSAASLELARRAIDAAPGQPILLVRLDPPARIAALASSPCPRCAATDLLEACGPPAAQAAFVVMIAAAEALRLLSGERAMRPRLLEFAGYAARETPMARRAQAPRCACERHRGADA